MPLDYIIRSEKVSDIPEVESLICQAFSQEQEANVVNKLRDCGALTFSLVAEDSLSKELLGHASLSLVSIEGEERNWQALALAPLAVLPKYKNQGIGTALINFWFREYAGDFYNAVFLLGDPNYYQRFGFLNAAQHGFYWSSGCENSFQVKEIRKGFLQKAQGKVYYHEAFSIF